MKYSLYALAGLLLAASTGAAAQSLSAVNGTSGNSTYSVDNNPTRFAVTGDNSLGYLLGDVIPLRPGAMLGKYCLRGPAAIATADYNVLNSSEVVLISCDGSSYQGLIDASQVLQGAISKNPTAIVAYSVEFDHCDLSGDDSSGYRSIFTTKSVKDALHMLERINHVNKTENSTMVLGDPNAASENSSSQDNPLGPSPSTAVAMIILYSITGVITTIFLGIIITGAIRAHRHPERYGPRVIMGRARQSRARGLARAMLDSLPIVKFGDRQEGQPKPADIELESGAAATHTAPAATTERSVAPKNVPAATETTTETTTETQQPAATGEAGIAAAATDRSPSTDEDNSTGCSICTEDFVVGEDQRVLPCDHKFHPACVDPWLLNVSGTCPLCRIDLNPQARPNLDENGDPIPDDGTAPPLGLPARQLPSLRRSLMIGLMGHQTEEERQARRERRQMRREMREAMYRDYSVIGQIEQAVREAEAIRAAEIEAGIIRPEEDEGQTRRRLRNLFRVRTRRTGESEDREVEGEGSGEGSSEAGNSHAEASGSGEGAAPASGP